MNTNKPITRLDLALEEIAELKTQNAEIINKLDLIAEQLSNNAFTIPVTKLVATNDPIFEPQKSSNTIMSASEVDALNDLYREAEQKPDAELSPIEQEKQSCLKNYGRYADDTINNIRVYKYATKALNEGKCTKQIARDLEASGWFGFDHRLLSRGLCWLWGKSFIAFPDGKRHQFRPHCGVVWLVDPDEIQKVEGYES